MIRHFLSQNDVSQSEIIELLDLAAELRSHPLTNRLAGRSLVMFFEKTSTRTRLSFEIAMTQLGGHAVHLDRDSSQLSRGESIRDTAQVVSRYADAMMARVNSHNTLVELAEYSTIPVINGLSDVEHPMQSMGDLLTIRNHKGRLEELTVAYCGDGNNNVTHSLLLACSRVGANVRVAAPGELQPSAEMVNLARKNAAESGGEVIVTQSPEEAVDGADVVYTDVWVSMGQDDQRAKRIELLRPYQVNADLARRAKPDHIFMHCLPQHLGEEVTEDVAYGPNSVIFDQAANRLHIQKATLIYLLEGAQSHG